MLYMPVIFLFYKENGFETTELFGLHAIYSIIIAVLEVPSGYIADVWGRKNAIVIGTFFGVLGFSTYSISYTFWGFVVAEILLGIGESLISGADSAILYDTLHQQKRSDNYLKIEGRLSAIGNVAEAMAGLFVSLIVFRYVRTNFILQAVLSAIAFLAACYLIEPKYHSLRKKPGFKEILQIVHYTFRINKTLGKYLIFSALIGFSSLIMAWFAQPVFSEVGLEKSYYGYAWVILNLCVAFGSLMALRINYYFGHNKIIIFLAFTMSAGFITIAFKLTYIAFISMIIFYFIRGTAHPILKNYINNLTTSDKRATVLSLRSLLIRILYSGFGPLLGVVSDTISLKLALILCGTGILIPSTIYAILIITGQKERS